MRRFALPTGMLELKADVERWPFDALCAVAARHNPRRGFLLVSRVLGRHLPTSPAVMRDSARDLATLLPTDLPGPVLVFGLAETAVCLGQLVHREWRALSRRDDLFFLHSTRQMIDAELLCRFEEPHSHAAAHLVYRPQVDGFDAPRSLVLVDDEISTGTTLANAAAALVGTWPGLEAIVAATLTDWSGGGWEARLPRPGRTVALLTGGLRWTPDPAAGLATSEKLATGALGRLARHRNRGRLGARAAIGDETDLAPPPMPARVVGTGEFTFPPFVLAERWERAGADVVVQATSRSPAPIAGAIRHAHVFADNYATGVPNYLYNASPGDGRVTWIGHETPADSVDPALVAALDARLIAWPA